MSNTAPPAPSKPRRKRILLFALGGLVLLFVIVLAMLPTLVSWGFGHGYIKRAINEQINGRADFARINASWWGDQSINRLTIDDVDGQRVADVDVSVHAGLYQIITKRPGPLMATVSGSVNGEVREDGTLSFADLLRKDPAGSTRSPPPSPSPGSEPFRLPDVPQITVRIAGLDVVLQNAATNQSLAIKGVTGHVAMDDPALPITLELQGEAIADGAPGTFKITGRADDLFSSSRTLSLRGASLSFDALVEVDPQSKGVPLPFPLETLPGPAYLQLLKINVASDDLTSRIVGVFEAVANVADHPQATITSHVALGNVLTTDGALSMRGGSANFTMQANNLPFRNADLHGIVHQFKATAVSTDLTQTTVIAIDSNAQLDGQPASMLTASLSIDELFAPDGALQPALEKITGTLQAATLPTAVAQPFFNGTPIVLARDVGPVMDANASFSLPRADRTRDVSLAAAAALLTIEIQATADLEKQSINGRHALIKTPRIHPDLIKGFTNLSVDRPLDVAVRLTSFAVPAFNEQTKSYPLQQFAAHGTIGLLNSEPVTIALPSSASDEPPATDAAEPITFAAANALLQVNSPGLGDHVDVNGSAMVDGASVTLAHRITRLFDSAGALDPFNALPAGTMSINNLPVSTVVKFAPAHTALLNEVLGQSINATVTTTAVEADLGAAVEVSGGNAKASLEVQRRPEALQIAAGQVDLNVTPEVVAMFQPEAQKPIVLVRPAKAIINLQSFALPAVKTPEGYAAFQYTLPTEPIRANFEAPGMALRDLPQIVEPINISDVAGDVAVQLQSNHTIAQSKGQLRINAASGDPQRRGLISHVDYTFTATSSPADSTGAAPPMAVKAELSLTELSVPRLERVMGREAGELSQWTGAQGDLAVKLDGTTENFNAAIRSGMANFAGNFTASKQGDVILLHGSTDRFVLPREAVEKRMNPAPASVAPRNSAAGDGSEARPSRARSNAPTAASPSVERSLRILEDIPLALNIKQLRFPLTMFTDQSFDPKTVAVDVTLTGEEVQLVTTAAEAGDVQSTLTNLHMALSTANLADGLHYTIRSDAEAMAIESPPAGAPQEPASAVGTRRLNQPTATPAPTRSAKPGSLDVSGKIVRLVTEESKLQLAGAAVQMTATVKEMPTAVADAVAKMEGLVVAAVGPIMNANFKVHEFSSTTGRLEARIDTTNGWLEALVVGREDMFRLRENSPLKAELAITPPLRERLLYKLHPVLADIRTTEQPLRASIYGAVPADADLSKLNADIEITIGKVAFDSGSTTMTLLKLAGQQQRGESIPGEIEPIIAKVRKGIVTYDRFAVHIDKWKMMYSGQIDLVKETMNLRTEIPLAALAHSFQELEAYADKIVVPIVVRGKFGEAKPALDPDFDIGKEAVRAGFSGAVDQLLRGKGGKPLEDLFKRIAPPR